MDKFNVIYIAIDTLRADHLGCYGYARNTSPNIDRIAGEGVLFKNAFAPAIPTHPSYTTQFTGVYPTTHRVVCHGYPNIILDKNILLLQEILDRNGFTTIGVDNLATRTLGITWFVRGFDYYIDISGKTVVSRGVKINASIVNEKVFYCLENICRFQQPFFLFIHYWDPHAPYIYHKDITEHFYDKKYRDNIDDLEKSPWGRLLLRGWVGKLREKGVRDRKYIEALYDGEIRYVDSAIKEVVNKLSELELYENTLLIITADHGEGMGEHGIYYDHHGLYDWDIHIPLIIRFPESLYRRKIVEKFVQHIDLVPTILDLLSIEIPKNVEGKSLIRIVEEDENGYDSIYSVENTRMTKRAIRTNRYKLIETLRPDFYGNPAGFLELYDLDKDPLELNNIAEENIDLAYLLLGKMEKWFREKLNGRIDPLMEQDISLKVKI